MHVSKIPAKLAAVGFGFAALGQLGFWWIFLFHATPERLSALEYSAQLLSSTFSSENDQFWWFVGWVGLTGYLILMTFVYCSSIVQRRSLAIALAVTAAVITIGMFMFSTVGFTMVLPLAASVWWAYDA